VERVAVDSYVLDSLMPDLVGHDRKPSAFLVYLWLWRRTKGASHPAGASAQMIADGTGLSKGSVQAAVRSLARRRLVDVKRRSATATPTFTLICHWRDR
jgi:DNA-binding MarR family transcriptional regulator